jgi:hypothetical protein
MQAQIHQGIGCLMTLAFFLPARPMKRLAALAGSVTLLSACGGHSAIDPAATANYIGDVVFQQTGFRPVDVRCPTGIPAPRAAGSTATSPALRDRTPRTYAS